MAMEVEFCMIMLSLLSLYFNKVRDRQLLLLSLLLVFFHGIVIEG